MFFQTDVTSSVVCVNLRLSAPPWAELFGLNLFLSLSQTFYILYLTQLEFFLPMCVCVCLVVYLFVRLSV